MSAKIQFRSGKTKTKVFGEQKKEPDSPDTSVRSASALDFVLGMKEQTDTLFISETKSEPAACRFDKKTSILDRLSKEERTEEHKKPVYKKIADVFRDLSDQLLIQFGIDAVSVYQRTEKNNDGKIHFRRLFGAEINKFEIEKYFGYTSPVILTNAEGFADNASHRSRLIERHSGDYLIVVSGSAYEAFRSEYDLSKIRYEIAGAFKEVERI